MSAIYRKYRPQLFTEMIGQNHIKITLQHELERNEINHAYLFCGPRGLGKTTAARIFAKSLNCEKRLAGESEPCNQCQSCLDITNGRSINVIEIDAASNTGVDNVRENIIENSRFVSSVGKYKVFIIDEAHMLSTSAFNALLKIMEEPPKQVIFILCTTEIHKLPSTVISRCQRFDFKRVASKELANLLEKIIQQEKKQVAPEVIDRIIAYSDGCVRDAQSLLGKILSLGNQITLDQAEIILPRSDFNSVYNFVYYLAEKNSIAAIELVNKLVEEGVDLVIFTENILEFLRQLLLIKVDERLESLTINLSEDLSKKIIELSKKFNYAELIDLIEEFLNKPKEIKQSSIPQFPLEIAIVRLVEKVVCSKPDNIFLNQNINSLEKLNVNNFSALNQKNFSSTEENQSIVQSKINKNFKDKDEDIPLVIDDIINQWEVIIKKIVEKNFSLASILKLSQPLNFSKGILEVAVSNKFYKDRIESDNCQGIIENVFQEILGYKILIKGIVSKSVQPLAVNIEFQEENQTNLKEQSSSAASKIINKFDVVEEIMNLF